MLCSCLLKAEKTPPVPILQHWVGGLPARLLSLLNRFGGPKTSPRPGSACRHDSRHCPHAWGHLASAVSQRHPPFCSSATLKALTLLAKSHQCSAFDQPNKWQEHEVAGANSSSLGIGRACETCALRQKEAFLGVHWRFVATTLRFGGLHDMEHLFLDAVKMVKI